MSHLSNKLRVMSAVAAGVLALVPVVQDLHFATTDHRWCPVHERIEDIAPPRTPEPESTRPGVSRADHITDAVGHACPVLGAMRPVTGPLHVAILATSTVRSRAPQDPVLWTLRAAVLHRAPKHGPPTA